MSAPVNAESLVNHRANHLADGTTLFEERTEQVYFMPTEATQAFVDRVSAQLEVDHHYRDDGRGSGHYVTTLYFDSDTRAIARACAHGEGVRLRAREYDDGQPHVGDRQATVWMEIKTREAGHTRKVRFPIPIHDVSTYLHDGYIDAEVLRQPHWSGSTDDVQRSVGELLLRTHEPLRPDCVAHYRRRAWQDTQVRVTVDTELSFYRPPAELFVDGQALHEALVEPPVKVMRESLVEIKLRVPQPKWLRELIDEFGLRLGTGEQRSFSKFIAASRAVHR